MDPEDINIGGEVCSDCAETGIVTRNEWRRRRDGLCLVVEIEAIPVVAASIRRHIEDAYDGLVTTSTGPDHRGLVWVRAIIRGVSLGVRG